LTFSNVISLAALFVALGGSAYAALDRNSVGTPQLKKNAVTSSKLRGGAVTTAKIKAQAVTGGKIKLSTLGKVPSAERADTATTAAPLAYARVAFAGTIDPAFAKGLAASNLQHPSPGIYCFTVSYAVKTGQVTVEADPEPDDIASIALAGPSGGALPDCPAGSDVEVITFDAETNSGLQDDDFYIELNN
jgi:hypothetical protein